MKNACKKWQEALLEAAISRRASGELEEHLSRCPVCSAELGRLRARNEKVELLLPLLASTAAPSPSLGARILAAAEASPTRPRFGLGRVWAFGGAAAVILIGAIVTLTLERRAELTSEELGRAQALASWQAPSDVLLRTPGREFLSTVPTLGGSYFEVGIETKRGEL